MRYFWQHLQTILATYKNEVPLHHFLKQYYKRHPKLGSRDRRGLSDATYSWYRCSKAFANDTHPFEEQVIAVLFLCQLCPKAIANHFPEAWQQAGEQDLAERIALLQAAGFKCDLEAAFPIAIDYSAGITRKEWMQSLLRQPQLFLRIRKDKEAVIRLLQNASTPFEWLSPTCLVLPNGTSAETLLPADSYVIQDASSQATQDFFKPLPNEAWWDCCSGAGGKSLLLKDLQPNVQLQVSDVRESILRNLRERFLQYHHSPPKSFVLDTANAAAVAQQLGIQRFDAILCDVPCTGAGTWARTPEQYYFFKEEDLEIFTTRQAAILRHAADYIKENGRIIYITCSVFKAENEDIVQKIAGEKNLRITSMQLINGIPQKADCLFVAVLEKEKEKEN